MFSLVLGGLITAIKIILMYRPGIKYKNTAMTKQIITCDI